LNPTATTASINYYTGTATTVQQYGPDNNNNNNNINNVNRINNTLQNNAAFNKFNTISNNNNSSSNNNSSNIANSDINVNMHKNFIIDAYVLQGLNFLLLHISTYLFIGYVKIKI
jgi:hypothetical protein